MDLRHVRIFLTVFKHGNISSAANDLGMNQPALSKMLRRLEGELQVNLFERTPRGVRPSIYGTTLARFAQAIDSNYRNAIRQIDSIRDAQVGEVVVGAGGTWRDAFIPEAVAQFRKGRPKARVRIESGSAEALMAALLRGEVDFTLSPTDAATAMSDALEVTPLLHTRLVVVGRAGHPAAARGPLSLDELAELDWVLPGGTFVRQRFEHVFTSHGVSAPIPMVEVDDASCVFSILVRTDMVTYVSETRMRSRPEGPLTILQTPDATEPNSSGIVTLRSGQLTPLCRELIACIKAAASAE